MNIWKPVGIAAAVVLVFGVSVNVSPAFAQTLEEIPVVGGIAKILTVRSYTQQDENKTVTIQQPAITDMDTEFSVDVNAEIQRVVDEYIAQAESRIEEDRKAFLATGGTEEEFAAKNIRVDVTYDIKSQTEEWVSFVIHAAESDSNGHNESTYYNLDLNTGKYLTLGDLLGADYVSIANAAVQAQMAARTEIPYFAPDQGGFATVDESTDFFIDDYGNPVIVFERYEVAPGGYGAQEFEIQK